MPNFIKALYMAAILILALLFYPTLGLADSGPVTASAPDAVGSVILDNWNKSGCSYTNTIRFRLSSDHDIGLARTWLNWPEGATQVPFELRQGGVLVLKGKLGRNGCDPYQQSWCEGVSTWNVRLPAGQYIITTGLNRVCANQGSNNNGFLALYEMAQPLPRSAETSTASQQGNNSEQAAGAVTPAGLVGTGQNRLSLGAGLPMQDGRIILHPGEPLRIRFQSEDGLHERSWIGIVAEDATEDPTPAHSASNNMKARTSGTLTSEVPRVIGDYRLWMYDAWNRQRLAELPIRITLDKDSATLSLPGGPQVEAGQSFEVDFTASPYYSYYDWVAVVAADTPQNAADAEIPLASGTVRLEGRRNGRLTLTAPSVPGRYLLRMQDQEFNTALTEVALLVVPPSASAPPPPDAPASGPVPPQSGSGQSTNAGTTMAPGPAAEDGSREVVSDLSAVRFQPLPNATGSPNTEVKIGHLESINISFGVNIEFETARRSYVLSEDERSSHYDPGKDVHTVDTTAGFQYLDFGTEANDDAMTALSGETGIDCVTEAVRPRLDGNVFSYQLNFQETYKNYATTFECVLDLVGVISPDGKSVSLSLKYTGLQLSWANDFQRPDRWDWIKNMAVAYKITNLPLTETSQAGDSACLVFSADARAILAHGRVEISDVFDQERTYYPHRDRDIQPIDTPEDLTVTVPKNIWWNPDAPDNGIRVELCGTP